MHILGLPTDIFNVYPATIKFKTYQARWQVGDIYVSGDARKTEDNPQGLGCYLVMTGRGCDDIFRILDSRNYTFGDMFRRCERRYGLDNFHFTRLDIAIDDKNEKPFGSVFFEGKTIPCISLKGQKVFHSGYELRDKDKHDISILESLSK